MSSPIEDNIIPFDTDRSNSEGQSNREGQSNSEGLSKREGAHQSWQPVLSADSVSSSASGDGAEISGRQKSITFIPVERIKWSPFQTRRDFNESALADLARSIEGRGVIQPIVVRPLNAAPGELYSYELVTGERRLRAAKLAQLSHVPAIIQDLTDRGSLEVSIIENAQREDLNPIEEALAYKRFVDEFDIAHAEIARVVGKNRATVTNALRLLQLAPEVVDLIRANELSAGHGRALLTLPTPADQLRIARVAIARSFSVRALEEYCERYNSEPEADDAEFAQPDGAALARTRAKLADALGVDTVRLGYDTRGQRRLQITFPNDAAWRRFTARFR